MFLICISISLYQKKYKLFKIDFAIQYNRRDMERRDMEINSQFKFYDGRKLKQNGLVDLCLKYEKRMRQEILDYYDICMSEEYENFNYIKSLIKKNKSIGILSKISTDIITEEISKYIKKHEFYYKPVLYLNAYAGKVYDLSNIWYVNSFDLQEFYLNKIKEQFPECSKYITMNLDCITKYDQNGISMIQQYKKSEEYKKDRRLRIELAKRNTDIVDLKKRYAENEYELAYILDRVIDIYETLRKFGESAEIGKTLTLYWTFNTMDYKLKFQNCNKMIKVYKFRKFENEDNYVSYGDCNKPIYSFRKYTQDNPPNKLIQIIEYNINDNEFRFGERQRVVSDKVWRWDYGSELMRYHLYEGTTKTYEFLDMQK